MFDRQFLWNAFFLFSLCVSVFCVPVECAWNGLALFEMVSVTFLFSNFPSFYCLFSLKYNLILTYSSTPFIPLHLTTFAPLTIRLDRNFTKERADDLKNKQTNKHNFWHRFFVFFNNLKKTNKLVDHLNFVDVGLKKKQGPRSRRLFSVGKQILPRSRRRGRCQHHACHFHQELLGRH